MKYNGTDYNEQWVLRLSLEEFVKHIANKGKDERELKEVWNLIRDANVLIRNSRSLYGNYINSLSDANNIKYAGSSK